MRILQQGGNAADAAVAVAAALNMTEPCSTGAASLILLLHAIHLAPPYASQLLPCRAGLLDHHVMTSIRAIMCSSTGLENERT